MNFPSDRVTIAAQRPSTAGNQICHRVQSIQRQQKLFSNLSCFQPGNQFSKVHFVANAHSVHVERWLTLLAQTSASVQIDTANVVPAFTNSVLSTRPLVPDWLRIPMTLRYLLGGLVLRLSSRTEAENPLVAHCASGNGFMAWLSGQKYVIVAYGTEIFSARERGYLYRWLMKRILQGAQRIADCSPECTMVLREQFQIPAEKIYSFHLGYDEEHFCPVSSIVRMNLRREARLPVDEPVWVINRRTRPLYRTREVVQGFLRYCESGGTGRLVVLSGDHDPDYTQSIRNALQNHPHGDRVVVVRRMLNPAEFAAWMQLSDFSISVPQTDNFSISILESMGCGTVPILSNLTGYDELRECRPIRWMTDYDPTDFARMFANTAASWPARQDAERNECIRFVQARYSTEKAIRDIADFFLGNPLLKHETQSAKRVA